MKRGEEKRIYIDDYIIIERSNGTFLISLCDEHILDDVKYRIKTWKNNRSKSGNKGTYVYCLNRDKHVFLHNLIINNTTHNMVCDHINGDSLDNRIENLRLVSLSDNASNRSKIVGKQLPTHITTCRDKYFVFSIKKNGNRFYKSFSIKKLGYQKALTEAIECKIKYIKESGSSDSYRNGGLYG